MKFKVGDIVRQVDSGYGTSPHDNGKIGKITEVGLHYRVPFHGITIETFGQGWDCHQEVRGEEGFELVADTESLEAVIEIESERLK